LIFDFQIPEQEFPVALIWFYAQWFYESRCRMSMECTVTVLVCGPMRWLVTS